MNIDKIATTFVAGIITIGVLTTVLGRGNTPKVLDSIGNAGSNLMRASLGQTGTTIR